MLRPARIPFCGGSREPCAGIGIVEFAGDVRLVGLPKIGDGGIRDRADRVKLDLPDAVVGRIVVLRHLPETFVGVVAAALSGKAAHAAVQTDGVGRIHGGIDLQTIFRKEGRPGDNGIHRVQRIRGAFLQQVAADRKIQPHLRVVIVKEEIHAVFVRIHRAGVDGLILGVDKCKGAVLIDTEPKVDVVVAPQPHIIVEVVVAVHGIDLLHGGSRADSSRRTAGRSIAAAAGAEDAACQQNADKGQKVRVVFHGRFLPIFKVSVPPPRRTAASAGDILHCTLPPRRTGPAAPGASGASAAKAGAAHTARSGQAQAAEPIVPVS